MNTMVIYCRSTFMNNLIKEIESCQSILWILLNDLNVCKVFKIFYLSLRHIKYSDDIYNILYEYYSLKTKLF